MDPNAALELYRTHVGEARAEAAENLRTWVRNGGFEPAWTAAERNEILSGGGGKRLRFPSIAAVSARLREVNAGTRRLNGPGHCDVRLQVYANGEWAIRWGLSDYDTDHRGFWGASSVPGGRFNSVDVARDLIRQARDEYASS